MICIFISQVFSCGRQEFPEYKDSLDQREEYPAGIFHGKFSSINSHKFGAIEGHTTIWVRGIQFYAKVVLNRGKENIRYEQYIHAGDECPATHSDRDSNGLIDMTEVVESSGAKLIPLDRDLNSQLGGINWFPFTNSKGRYAYSRSAAVFKLMDDLRNLNQRTYDGMVKLQDSEKLDLHRRTIILYSTLGNVRLPVACAKLRKE